MTPSFTLFESTAFTASRKVTQAYSTSFSLGIRLLARRFHDPIYGIYGFVRYADEIVDTFHDFDKAALLAHFRQDTERALVERISLNPILHAFQAVVHRYGIEKALIDAFLDSMEMDLDCTRYDPLHYNTYIYGSAEVVGLMCLRVFCEGDNTRYQELVEPARRLGAAFQKINFLRDMRSDFEERGRVYFPGVDFNRFDAEAKRTIEADIAADFAAGLAGIRCLPVGARLGVYVAYVYYSQLFNKIRALPASKILHERIRISDSRKMLLLLESIGREKLNLT